MKGENPRTAGEARAASNAGFQLVAIAAMARDRVIGRRGEIPWHLPEDFRWFKQTTMGGTLIMGRRTFGKGSVQTIIPINEHAALKLTTARYFTPSGRSIQAEGIEPDIELEKVRVSKAEQKTVKPLKEADLSGHLENGNGKGNKPNGKAAGKDKENAPLAAKDYQLGEALNLLKGLAILRERKAG